MDVEETEKDENAHLNTECLQYFKALTEINLHRKGSLMD